MYRNVIAVLVVVIVFAAVAVTAVMLAGRGERTEPATDLSDANTAPAPASPEETKPVIPMSGGPKRPADEPDETAAAPSDEAPEVKAPAPEPAPAEPAGDGKVATRISALLESLSDGEQKELERQINERRRRQWQEQARHQLPSDRLLYSLRWRNRGALKLTDVQEQQIKELKEIMKPKMDAAMADIWARQEQLQQEVRQLAADGRMEEAKPLFEEMRNQHRETAEGQKPLDEEYRQMLTGVLTPEQMEAIEQPSPQLGGWAVPRTGNSPQGSGKAIVPLGR